MVNFNSEVYVARGVDNIELMIFLKIIGGCWLDGDILFCFLFYEVYGGFVFVYFVEFMDFFG